MKTPLKVLQQMTPVAQTRIVVISRYAEAEVVDQLNALMTLIVQAVKDVRLIVACPVAVALMDATVEKWQEWLRKKL